MTQVHQALYPETLGHCPKSEPGPLTRGPETLNTRKARHQYWLGLANTIERRTPSPLGFYWVANWSGQGVTVKSGCALLLPIGGHLSTPPTGGLQH